MRLALEVLGWLVTAGVLAIAIALWELRRR
jgi:hypothetical protein